MRLIWTLIGILVLVHAYFYVRYRTIDPCEAAIVKVTTETPTALPRVAELIAKRDLGAIGQCYLIGIIGTEPAPAGTPAAATPPG